MRDPDRIEPMLDMVREAWEAAPDLRLGQLIYHAAEASSPGSLPPCPGLVSLEDDAMVRGLITRR